MPVLCGIGVVEDERERAESVHVLRPDEFFAREPELEGIGAFRLAAGDSSYWSPRQPYRWSNPSAADAASVLWVLLPAVF